MRPHALVLLPLLIAAFAGCSSAATDTTHLVVVFNGQATDFRADVASHLGDRPSGPEYVKANLTHPAFYNAHDQLAEWAKQDKGTYATQSFNGSFGSGFFLTSLANVAADGTNAYWSLALNGVEAQVGMSALELHAGDTVTWTYAKAAAAPASNSSTPFAFFIDNPAPTTGDVGRLGGNSTGPAQVTITASHNGTVWATRSFSASRGSWSLDLPGLPYGESFVAFAVDDGKATYKSHATTLVRLANYTFEVQYGHYPGLSNSVDTVTMDPDAHLSAPLYAGKSTPHPDFATVHDLTVAWTNKTGATVEIAWSDSVGGYSMSKINGAGNPLDSGLPPYWLLDINGVSANFGMSAMPVSPGDHVTWCLNACGT